MNRLGVLRAARQPDVADGLLEDVLGKRMNQNDHRGALALVDQLPQIWVSPRIQAMVWMARTKAGLSREEITRARQEAEAAYEAGERNPRLLYFLADTRQMDGLNTLARQILEEALVMELGDLDRTLLLHPYCGTLETLGEHALMLEKAREMLTLAERRGRIRHVGIANDMIGVALEGLGHQREAEEYYLRSINIFRRTDDCGQLLINLNNFAQTLTDQGRPAEAEQLLNEARGLPCQSPIRRAWLSFSTANLHHQYGRHAEALISTAEAAELVHQARLTNSEIMVRLMHAERLAFDGQHRAAGAALDRARTLVGEAGKHQAQVQFTSGVVAFSRGDLLAARQAFGVAVELGERLVSWDRARLELYRLGLTRARGEDSGTVQLEQALSRTQNDFPLLTDAAALAGTLKWLANQPGWTPRLDRVFSQPPAGTVQLRLEPFGPFEVFAQDRRIAFPLRRSAELLAYLALYGSANRQELLTALFDGEATPRSVDLLKKALKGLRGALQSLLPVDADPIISERRRYTLTPLLDLCTAWLPERLFPAPAMRYGGPVDVRGAFLADAQGEWAVDLRGPVHDALRDHLQAQVDGGDMAVRQSLSVLRGLD